MNNLHPARAHAQPENDAAILSATGTIARLDALLNHRILAADTSNARALWALKISIKRELALVAAVDLDVAATRLFNALHGWSTSVRVIALTPLPRRGRKGHASVPTKTVAGTKTSKHGTKATINTEQIGPTGAES